MEVESWSLRQPLLDLGLLVSGVVVEHEVDVHVRRDVGLDVPQERQELLMPVTRLALRQDVAGGDVECGEQRRGAMPLVVVRDALDVAETQR